MGWHVFLYFLLEMTLIKVEEHKAKSILLGKSLCKTILHVPLLHVFLNSQAVPVFVKCSIESFVPSQVPACKIVGRNKCQGASECVLASIDVVPHPCFLILTESKNDNIFI